MNLFETLAVVAVVCIVFVSVFLVSALMQIKKTAFQAEQFLRQMNQEMSMVSKITSAISEFAEQFTSPWIKAGAVVTSVVSSLISRFSNK